MESGNGNALLQKFVVTSHNSQRNHILLYILTTIETLRQEPYARKNNHAAQKIGLSL